MVYHCGWGKNNNVLGCGFVFLPLFVLQKRGWVWAYGGACIGIGWVLVDSIIQSHIEIVKKNHLENI